jgi:hypothetical protein
MSKGFTIKDVTLLILLIKYPIVFSPQCPLFPGNTARLLGAAWSPDQRHSNQAVHHFCKIYPKVIHFSIRFTRIYTGWVIFFFTG